MTDLLYLDTARLGRMSPASAALRDFVTMAEDEGGGLYSDCFLANGFRDCPASFSSRYPNLAGWHGVGGLKAGLRSLVESHPDSPVLLASRSTALMRFAARILFHPCRNALTTDLDWPAYKATPDRRSNRVRPLADRSPPYASGYFLGVSTKLNSSISCVAGSPRPGATGST